MGDVIMLAERRAARRTRTLRAHAPSRVEFLFDLSCPFSYLAAERVERACHDVIWTPASSDALSCGTSRAARERTGGAAERRAGELRLPLVWPDRFPDPVPAAMRVAAYASECGRGAAFVLAAGRLAFCGGFDLDDPEVLAEASAAAGIGLDGCLQAAGDLRRDGAIEAAGRSLLALGADRLPALRAGHSLFWGEDRVAEASAAARTQATAAAR